MALELHHNNPEFLRDLFDYIKELANEITLHVNENGISIRENDKSSIGTINVALSRKCFSKYVVPEAVSLRIDAVWTSKIFTMIPAGSKVKITQPDDLMRFVFESDQGAGTFESRLLDADPQPFQMAPEISDGTWCTMMAHEWETAISNYRLFNDDLTIKFETNDAGLPQMSFICDSAERCRIVNHFVTTPPLAFDPIAVKCATPAEGVYNLTHLQSYRGQKLSTCCKIQLLDNMPLYVTFDFDKIGKGYGRMQYVLAPKVID
eukprot:GEMP01024277.1.p1 GENE.GEMP01024277.1~~GEMP01024277.1.p1  ORF type:complete len:263 (+),score=71.02 GEMP01024277.1:43-831(+)